MDKIHILLTIKGHIVYFPRPFVICVFPRRMENAHKWGKKFKYSIFTNTSFFSERKRSLKKKSIYTIVSAAAEYQFNTYI